MTTTIRACDVSNYSATDLTELIAAEQITHVVVRASTESAEHRQIAREQLQSALDNGCSVSAYIWCRFDLNPVEHTADALSTLDGFGPIMVWMDTENDCPPGQFDNWLSQAVDLAEQRGHKVGIYARKNWWETHDDSHGFTRLPLWAAQYDGVPKLESVEWFGGWIVASGKQYAGGDIDRDVFDAKLFPVDPLAVLKVAIGVELEFLSTTLTRLDASLERLADLIKA